MWLLSNDIYSNINTNIHEKIDGQYIDIDWELAILSKISTCWNIFPPFCQIFQHFGFFRILISTFQKASNISTNWKIFQRLEKLVMNKSFYHNLKSTLKSIKIPQNLVVFYRFSEQKFNTYWRGFIWQPIELYPWIFTKFIGNCVTF